MTAPVPRDPAEEVPGWARWIPHAWSVFLPLLLLGPALGPGYVLSYDMVWVPDLALRSDFVGGGAGQPRAVPSDAVVSVLDEVVPGMLLQKLVLLGALVLLGQGVLRLAGPALSARMVAVSLAVWSPFVAERLGIGHWPVLLGCAVVPWLVHLLAGDRERLRWPVWLLVPLGCLSASAGVVTAVVLLVIGLGPRPRRNLGVVALAVAGNAPWVVAGLLHAGSVPAGIGAAVFSPKGEGSLPAPLALLGLGGIWNREVVPPSRTAATAWVALVLLLLLVVLGARAWWARTPSAGRQTALWVVGYVVALVGVLAPDLVEAVGTRVPGAGVVRDGSRYLALCLPALVGAAGAGAERLVRGVSDRLGTVPAGLLALLATVLVPLVTLVDAGWGLGGQLRPAHYPADWAKARAVLAAADARAPGDVLVLPFASYRAPTWNHGRKVYDPLGRFLTPDYVADDRLRVDGRSLPGDDPRVPRFADGLARLGAGPLARQLAREGIRYVVVDRRASRAQTVPTGRILLAERGIEVVELAGPVRERTHGAGWWTALAVAWAAYLAIFLKGCSGLAVGVVRRIRYRRVTPANLARTR